MFFQAYFYIQFLKISPYKNTIDNFISIEDENRKKNFFLFELRSFHRQLLHTVTNCHAGVNYKYYKKYTQVKNQFSNFFRMRLYDPRPKNHVYIMKW